MLTDRDYQLLSEYLDGALNENERAALESRLSAEAELSRELRAMRETVALVKALNPRKAPRDFTLNASMVRRPVQTRFMFSSAFYSAVSAAAAVLLIGFGLLFASQSQNLAPAAVNQLQSVAQEEAQDIALAASETAVQKTSDGSLALATASELPAAAPPQTLVLATPTLNLPDNFNVPSGTGGESPFGNSASTGQAAQSANTAPGGSAPSPAEPPVAAQAYAPSTTTTTGQTPQGFTFAVPIQGGADASANAQATEQGFTTQADEVALDQTSAAGTTERDADTLTPEATTTAAFTATPTETPSATPSPTLVPQPTASRASTPTPAPLDLAEISLALGAVLLVVSIIFYIRSRSSR